MTSALAYTNGFIMALLGALHFYWACGGQWGIAQAVPSDKNGERVLRTSVAACLVVGTGLLLFSAYYWSKGTGSANQWPLGLGAWGIWALTVIFTARAIGDFRYVGFFKTMKNTEFGKLDTRWYAPLCLYLGISSAWIGLYT